MDKKAAYLNTGTWSTKAIKEAKLVGEVVEVAASADANFNYIPKGVDVPSDADYLHITTNNTIFGTQIILPARYNINLRTTSKVYGKDGNLSATT